MYTLHIHAEQTGKLARSAEEAMTLMKGKVTEFRALVTDIHLSGSMNGWEVAR